MSAVDIRVVDDPGAAAGELLAEAARKGGAIAVSGGSSVGRAYEAAAALEPDWSHVDLWWGDDRAVPPDHEHSNFLLVEETLLVSVTPRAVHRIEGELGAEEAARRYDAALAGVRLDFALNGIGPDGHTASLFPGAPGLEERTRRAVPAEAGLEPFVPRVTLTPPVFAATGVVVYLVAGAGKADAVRRAFAEPPTLDTPAAVVRGRKTIALLDAAAASQL